MVEIDPTELEIAELGPKIKDVDDADELREMLAREEDGEDRAPVKTLIEDRIETVEGDDGEVDRPGVDLAQRREDVLGGEAGVVAVGQRHDHRCPVERRGRPRAPEIV